MVTNTLLYDYFSALGVDETAAAVYTLLAEKGPLTLLQIARDGGVERTKLYRLADELIKSGLVEEQLAFKSRKLRAAPVARVRKMVENAQQKSVWLEQNWQVFAQQLEHEWKHYSPTETLYFRGREGLAQMTWNTLRAKKELCTYVYRAYQEIMGQKELDKWAAEAKASQLVIRELHSEVFQLSLRKAGFFSLNLVHMGSRYKAKLLPNKVMTMTHAMDIYDDVVGIHYWEGTEAFGVEIHNAKIARMQQSIFEVFWKLAKDYDYASNES